MTSHLFTPHLLRRSRYQTGQRKAEFTSSMGTAATLLSHHARWGYERPVAPGSGNVTFPIWLGPFRRTVPYRKLLVAPTDRAFFHLRGRGLDPGFGES